jgi:hypothetical protein
MDENNSNTPPAESGNLAKNEYVSQLFSILQDNGRDISGLSALIGHVSEMENFVKRAEDKISDMKSQLTEMKEAQGHPVRTALQNAIKLLENKIAEVRERLGELKNNITEGCKNAVAAFKEKGISALDKLASFFHIKSGLRAMDKNVTQSIAVCDKAIAHIDSFSQEYHNAGRAVKNMARVLVGKEPLDAKKETGKLAKAVAAPYKAERTVMLGLQKAINAAVNKLEQLETAVDTRQTERALEKNSLENKPSILGELEANLLMLAEQNREMITPERVKTKGVEL